MVVMLVGSGIAGCGGESALRPRPNIVVEGHHDTTLRLDFAPAVTDREAVLSGEGVSWITLDQWHQTLQNGFDAGFGKWFTVTRDFSAGLTLRLVSTVASQQPASGGDVVRIRYQAHLVDTHHTIVATSTGTATSRPEPGVQAVTRAVEAMYEQIATDLFTRRGPDE